MISPGTIPVVFVHVHYEDVWAEISRALEASFSKPFGLVLTSRPGVPELATPATPHLSFIQRITVENKGRDIWPFLRALERCEVDFEIGLKLHTKRSTHREDGNLWRRYIVDSLLSSPDGHAIAELMAREKRIGLVAPRAHLLSLNGRVATNGRLMRRMAKALDVKLDAAALKHGQFSAGSMFWFRREALSVFSTRRLASLFVEERGQLDGTAAHAAERLFAEIVKAQGYAAIPVEAVSPIGAALARGESLSSRQLAEIAESVSESGRNPFIFALPESWRRHPTLLHLAHYLYLRSPATLRRMLRQHLKPRLES